MQTERTAHVHSTLSTTCKKTLQPPRIVVTAFWPFLAFLIWIGKFFRRLGGKWKIPQTSAVVRRQVVKHVHVCFKQCIHPILITESYIRLAAR